MYSIVIFIASILSLVFLAFLPLNKVMKIVEKHEGEQSAIE